MNASTQPGFQLTDDIQHLPGVGPRRADDLRKLGITTIGDLLEYLPARHERHESRTIENLEEGMVATIVGRISGIRSRFGGRGPTVSARLIDNTGRCSLVWFNAEWMRGRIVEGMHVRATGRVQEYQLEAQLVNPKCEVLGEDAAPIDESDPATFAGVYPASAAVSSQFIGRLIASNLEAMLQQVKECHAPEILSKRGLAPRDWALRVSHQPTQDDDVERARRRLAYDELLLLQLATSLVRHHRRRQATAQPLRITDEIDRRIRLRFPFSLTEAQNRAVEVIVADLAESRPMNRLLQGDVGCGKTVVAFYAALVAVANRMQVAIMAPTEILAEQHADSIRQFLAGSRVRHDLLLGGMRAADRRRILANIESGDLDIVVGTHALIQNDVRFGRLGLVVVDEQHRFGVRQRATMRGKGPSPHYLVMTATPIPRTLAMTVFGDLDVTTIDALPPGRSPIDTRVVKPIGQPTAWESIRGRLDRGEQAFVVYPLIDESDKLELRAATTEYERLSGTVFQKYRVGLLHGRMNRAEREGVMVEFTSGRIDVLVATTVVEVGIDVPNATCMAIEHAERYGLSQLHQLRGRIGRGDKPGICFLMAGSAKATDNERLGVLAGTTDGFRIAEEDLRLRGPGEMMGTRQHGLPELRVADLVGDGELLRLAQQDAGDLVRNDPQLRRPEHADLRNLLSAKYADRLALLDIG